jgi:hypothetical protein
MINMDYLNLENINLENIIYYIFYLIIFLLIILIVGTFKIIKNINGKTCINCEGFNQIKDSNPKVEFPFKNLFNQDGEILNIILISAPFREKKHEDLYLEYKNKGLQFMGISSYSEFPCKLSNPHDSKYHEEKNHDYIAMCKTWLHCFRNPDECLGTQIPRLLFSESDLKDYNSHKPDSSIKIEYDFIYICLKDNDKCEAGWQSYIRNWELAKKCLDLMCRKYKLKGCIVGRENCEFSKMCDGIVKVIPFLKYHEFQKELQKCKFIFVPNIADASPRVIVEAMCYDKRILVNKNIIGGWKYIQTETGEGFTNEIDIDTALEKLLKNYNNYHPRQYFIDNYGKEKKGKELANFIKQHYQNIIPDQNKIDYCYITI